MTESAIPSQALEGLMKKVFVEGGVAPGLFWDAALKAILSVPLADRKEGDEGGQAAEGGDLADMPIQLGQDAKGRNVLWIFTSKDTMKSYTGRTFESIDLPGQELFDRIQDTQFEVVLIGPGNLTLNLDMRLVQSLAKGVVPQAPEEDVRKVPRDAKVKVGRVNEDTTALEERFVSIFEDLPEVEEASFMQIEDDTGPRMLLGLKLEEESRAHLQRIAGHIAKAAEGVLAPGKTMDVTLISGSLREAFQKYGNTFYKK